MTFLAAARVGFLVALALAAGSAVGQATKDITVDENGLCPADDVLKKGFPKVTQPSVGIGWTLTKLPEVPQYQSADGTEETANNIAFNTQLVVFGFSSDGERLFVRTVPSDQAETPTCGWVSTEMILVPRDKKFEGRFKTPQPLQMRDISAEHKESRNLLNVKAVVHDLSITGESEGGIEIFEDPRGGKATDKIRLFDAFGVFASMELESQGPDQETRYWLIGEQRGQRDATFLKGWIRQRDVVIWPSRLAVQWREDAIVKGYATPENLKLGVRELTLPERIDRADHPDQITRRLPVLEQSPPPDEVFERLPVGGPLDERVAMARKIIEYYKIATPGRACRKDNPNDCLSAKQIDAERERITSAEKAATKIDVLILIDATESMDPYLPITVTTIERFVKRAEDIRSQYDLRFAISLYGDYQSQEANYEKVDYRPIVPFFKPGPGLQGSDAMQLLVKDPKSLLFKDVHRDKLEAPFAAVIRAAKTARWRPSNEVPLRFIVHIGDAGNRDSGQTSASTQRNRYPKAVENKYPPHSTIVERYGGQDVVNVLRQMGIIYVPVLVEDGSSKNPNPSLWNKIFVDQTNAILNLLAEDAPTKETVITHAADAQEIIEKKVTDSILEIMFNVQSALDYQKCAPESKGERCANLKKKEQLFRSPEVVRLVGRVASVAAGLTSEQVRNIYSRDQSIVTMYAPGRWSGDKEMFTHWVALEQKEFKLLRDLLQTLCDNMSQQDSKSPVMKALREFSEMYASEDFTDLTVREILGKRLGIPNLERTDFSGRTRDEIDDAYRAWQSKGERATWENWHYRACKASKFTELMEDNKKIDPAQIRCDLVSHSCEAPEKAQRKFRWSVQVSQDSPVYYVPLDILP